MAALFFELAWDFMHRKKYPSKLLENKVLIDRKRLQTH